jgi:hypothetical protein
MLQNTNAERMLLEYGCGSDAFSFQNGYEYNKIVDSCLIKSQL